jgi:hypothetical protein
MIKERRRQFEVHLPNGPPGDQNKSKKKKKKNNNNKSQSASILQSAVGMPIFIMTWASCMHLLASPIPRMFDAPGRLCLFLCLYSLGPYIYKVV